METRLLDGSYTPTCSSDALPRSCRSLDFPSVSSILDGAGGEADEKDGRQWPWVQSGFMTLHTLSMLMKVHSYCSHNGELSDKSHQLRADSIKLDSLIEKAGGRAEVEKVARAAWEAQVAASSAMEEMPSGDSIGTEKEGLTLEAFGDDKLGIPNAEPSRDEGRHPSVSGLVRRRSRARKAPDAPNEEGKEATQESTPRAKDVPTAGFEVLTWHPDAEISALAIVLADLKDDLVSTGVGKVVYPSNVGYWNFLDYLLVPTLVYQLEYARTTK
jgi:sterol O-acyltransferase